MDQACLIRHVLALGDDVSTIQRFSSRMKSRCTLSCFFSNLMSWGHNSRVVARYQPTVNRIRVFALFGVNLSVLLLQGIAKIHEPRLGANSQLLHFILIAFQYMKRACVIPAIPVFHR